MAPEWIRDVVLAFIPLFVAVDIVGLVPLYLSLTGTMAEAERRPLVAEATLTAAAVGGGFLFLGNAILDVLGVAVGDLQIAGGVLLLVIAVHDLLHPDQPLRRPRSRVGVVPLGIPMIVGPAVLTTLLTVARTRGYGLTLAAFVANLVVVWATLRWAARIEAVIGEAGAQAVARVASLLLAAIGVTFIRQGVVAALSQVP